MTGFDLNIIALGSVKQNTVRYDEQAYYSLMSVNLTTCREAKPNVKKMYICRGGNDEQTH